MKCTMLNDLATLGKTTLTVHNTAYIVHKNHLYTDPEVYFSSF